MTSLLASLATALGGVTTVLVAQVSPAADDVTTWVTAGGATAAVGGLVYVARLLASGQLVSYPVEKLQEEATRREDRLEAMLKAATRREDTYHEFLTRRREPDA